MVSGNLVESRLDVHSNSRGTLKLPFTAFEIESVMGKGFMMLRRGHESEAAGGAL